MQKKTLTYRAGAASLSVSIVTVGAGALTVADASPAEGIGSHGVAAATMVTPNHAGRTITRAEVLKRARYWIKKKVPYSQTAYHYGPKKGKKYRQDCSGFVSMAWLLKTSRTTRTFGPVTHTVKIKNLKPGDAMLHKGHHVALFVKWADKSHSKMKVYEESTWGKPALSTTWSVHYLHSNGYYGKRYNKIR